MKTLISLFDFSGAWSSPYRANGWKVIQIDKKLGFDILEINENFLLTLGPVKGLIAAPPCTDFTISGAQYWPEKDEDGRTAESVKLVKKTLEIIDFFRNTLEFWAIENPVGRLNELVPELKEFGPWYFQPYYYGDPYTKKTGLWGKFNKPLKTLNIGLFKNEQNPGLDEVEPIRACKQGSWIQTLGGKSEKTKELRSLTPPGFSKAFYLANN